MAPATILSKLRLVEKPKIRCLSFAKVVKSCSIVGWKLVDKIRRAFAVKPTETKERYTATADMVATEKNCIRI